MGPEQETGRKESYTQQPSVDNAIEGYLYDLKRKGDWLVKQKPSNIEDDFLTELEMELNSFYVYLDSLLNSGDWPESKILITIKMTIVEIMESGVSYWAAFVRNNPGSRPREFFPGMKAIGERLRNLSKN